ncbi:MAG: LacI family transcriptional regulator [Spirochaetia bacterium]|nr:LacI family transcriptional regulator [Spirochaetia bacterium]
MAVKLKDIAQDTNVSISTVSRILNNDMSRKSNEQTVSKVFEAAERLGYFAQRLAPARYMEYKGADKTFSVACILTSEHETYVSPFFSALLSGIQQEVINQGAAFPHNFFVTYIKDPGFLKFIQNTQLDCAIMLGRTSLENITMLKSTIPNLVYAGVNEIGHGIDEVLCDAHLAVEEAIGYLIGLGHRDIGFIGPTQVKHQVFNEHRYQGFLDAMAKHAIPVSDKFVKDTILTANDGYESMKDLIRGNTLPSAIFCGNDTVAMGVMKALDEAGIAVPRDISIVGFDNIDTCVYLKPTLTTIDIPKRELGRLAVKVLLDRLSSNRQYSIRVTIPYSLMVRDSCRAIGR